MRIGIDAKWFFTGQVSGRVVLQNLLSELFAGHPEHEWVVFLDKEDKSREFPFRAPNIRIEYVWARNNMLSNTFLLSRKLRMLHVDVMVYQTFPSLFSYGHSVSFIHDVLFREFPEFFTWKERLYFVPLSWLTRNRAERLIATTEFVANDLIKYKYARKKTQIDIVPLAVSHAYRPVEFHDPRKLAEIRAKYLLPDRFLLFVGRLNVRKNIEHLLQAIPMIRDNQIPLVIVGQADWKTPDLRKFLAAPEIQHRILMVGSPTDEELTCVYAMAHIFCFPSFAEGFGLPPLEAMASGIPVIVSETTALPEVCGDAAVYIRPERPETIVQAIDHLMNDAEFYERQKMRGLEHAKKFTWKLSADAFMTSIRNAAIRVG